MTATTHRTDLEIHERIVSELDWDARFDAGEVGVETDDGIITLRGTVSSYSKLRAAEELAGRVPGVRAIVNELLVRDKGSERDLELAERARTALEMDAEVPSDRIECIVRNGHVKLRGTVDHAYEREAAEAAVGHIEGVRGLEIEIEIRGHTRGDGEIERDLSAALERRHGWDRAVEHHVENGVVTLSGRVPALADRIAAEATAWRTRGVRGVVDRIRVMGA